jgi:hypothetical protein
MRLRGTQHGARDAHGEMMEFSKHFEEALASEDPTAALRRLALDLASEGRGRRGVFKIFLDFDSFLQNEGRDYESALVGDVMDMISQHYPPFNLDIPEDGED